ncbi:MAG: PQQ-binding-like beta-propeller repeat protein [Pirellulaceae bacterium]|nr:PQQ-binding-like beta-propeller repeat protein [Pirellulaceae bacterium]
MFQLEQVVSRPSSAANRDTISQIAVFGLLLCVVTSTLNAQEHWPQFRGPRATGVSDTANFPEKWSATENVAWKCDIPGRGWSSPVVWGDKIFLTSVINTGESEEIKKGLYFGGDRPKPSESIHQWRVYCLSLDSGKILWEHEVHNGVPQAPIHLKSSYASETAVIDGQRVYFCFGNLGIFCFDLSGQSLWQHRLQPQDTRYGWGAAASPVLHDGRLYYCFDNEVQSYLVALDAATGTEVWQTLRDEKSNWATPYVWVNAQRTEIVVPGTGQVRSYDLDGKMLWSLTGMSSITIATPYEAEGLLYVSSGYVMDSKRPLYAIRPGATGDISLQEGQTANEFIAWCQTKAAPYNPSTLVYKGRLYVLYDRGTVSVFDAKSGVEVYGPERLPNGRAFTTSPWASRDRIYFLNEDGVTFVLNAGDDFELLHTNELAEDDMGMASPAMVGDRLLIRTAARLYCIKAGSTGSSD